MRTTGDLLQVFEILRHLVKKNMNWKGLLFLVVLLLIVIGSFFLDPQGFVVNTGAGILGIFLGFIVALVFFDQYQTLVRQRQWTRVRDLTYASITTHSTYILAEALISYNIILPPAPIRRTLDQLGKTLYRPTADTVEAATAILQQLDAIPHNVQVQNAKNTVKYFENIKGDLDRIGDILTPRVLQFSDDREIIKALIELDAARDRFQNSVYVEQTISLGIDFVELLYVLSATGRLLRTLAQDWT